MLMKGIVDAALLRACLCDELAELIEKRLLRTGLDGHIGDDGDRIGCHWCYLLTSGTSQPGSGETDSRGRPKSRIFSSTPKSAPWSSSSPDSSVSPDGSRVMVSGSNHAA